MLAPSLHAQMPEEDSIQSLTDELSGVTVALNKLKGVYMPNPLFTKLNVMEQTVSPSYLIM